ncbi:MAG: DUF2332 family protein [Pseudomonadota bacterium]
MSERLRAAFRSQAKSCAHLGSPFMGAWCQLMAERLAPGDPVSNRLLDWPGDVTSAGQSVPLRLAGALHALVLAGRVPDLRASFPPTAFAPDAIWRATMAAFETETDWLMGWLDSPPQTNEVRRSVALMTGALILSERFGLPFVLSELGASAGLNLHFDRYCLEVNGARFGATDSPVRLMPDWQGPMPPNADLHIADRAGVDLNPLDPKDADDHLRLMAYIWPDQPDRAALTQHAIALSSAQVKKGDAASWLGERLSAARHGHLHLVTHSVAWQYFPTETQKACLAHLDHAAAHAKPQSPLARLSMEADDIPGSAALCLQVWDGEHHQGAVDTLARVDFHGRALSFDEPSKL